MTVHLRALAANLVLVGLILIAAGADPFHFFWDR